MYNGLLLNFFAACCAAYEMPKVCQELCAFDVNMEEIAAQPDKYGLCLAYLEIYTTCASGEIINTKFGLQGGGGEGMLDYDITV